MELDNGSNPFQAGIAGSLKSVRMTFGKAAFEALVQVPLK
jgi:hypothetical protein